MQQGRCLRTGPDLLFRWWRGPDIRVSCEPEALDVKAIDEESPDDLGVAPRPRASVPLDETLPSDDARATRGHVRACRSA